MHEIIAAELSASNVTDGKVPLSLLKQTRQKINEISAAGVYDTRQYYETVRIKRAVSLIPPKKGANFGERRYSHNLAVSYQKLCGSNEHCKIRYGYHKRSLLKRAMFRIKKLLGGILSLRDDNAQISETYCMIKALNKLTGLDMYKIKEIV
ncbi:hypothetical protein BTN50_0578 [Candidatus Enterovibrio altilux]|uniref:Mobile element protein n=1 Tax=Candidatus Enterovibrio altilux TaxID=1927128 RepID=A0A291B7Y2_9GAMM|nr:hypothetical protein BTN50_0578 [Candidatus Enterovibrio luxaltus]